MDIRTPPNCSPTLNKRGFTYELSIFGESFLDFARQINHPVIDIGCAFGTVSLIALESGCEVISIDLSKHHLCQLIKKAPVKDIDRLTVRNEKFPMETNFRPNSIGAIYISHVIPFLSPEEVEHAVAKLYNWLVPGGKVFVVSFTPFIKLCAPYLPIYREKKRKGEPWAGLIENVSHFTTDPLFSNNLPERLNHMDVSDYRRVFERHAFEIEQLEYFGDEENLLPETLKLDGKERLGLIANKPLNKATI